MIFCAIIVAPIFFGCFYARFRFGIEENPLVLSACAFIPSFFLDWLLFHWVSLEIILLTMTFVVMCPLGREVVDEHQIQNFARALYRLLPSHCTHVRISWKNATLVLSEIVDPSTMTAHEFLSYQVRLEDFRLMCERPSTEWFRLRKHLPRRLEKGIEEISVFREKLNEIEVLRLLVHRTDGDPIGMMTPIFYGARTYPTNRCVVR